ncbi:MAG: SpoIIE family protein phosphatase [Bacteroidia bacterium]|nr:SpoIIE family protein phosphatase [Bacteroidia bacterium]
MKPFTNHVTKLQKGDTVYLFSDGFQTQFGGPDGTKFKTARFKELLVSVSSKPMKEQRMILNETLENWKNHLNPETNQLFEQTDDITLLAIHI